YRDRPDLITTPPPPDGAGTQWRKEAGEYLLAYVDQGVEVRESVADRKSTRLNSSHVKISYAVFCLKKKNSCTCSDYLFEHISCTSFSYYVQRFLIHKKHLLILVSNKIKYNSDILFVFNH